MVKHPVQGCQKLLCRGQCFLGLLQSVFDKFDNVRPSRRAFNTKGELRRGLFWTSSALNDVTHMIRLISTSAAKHMSEEEPLEKVPYRFRLGFLDERDKEHWLSVVDWEFYQLWRKERDRFKSKAGERPGSNRGRGRRE